VGGGEEGVVKEEGKKGRKGSLRRGRRRPG